MKRCPRCDKSRVIKLGLTQQKVRKQKYYCYKCGRTFTGEYQGGPFITNSSNITEEDIKQENEF